MTKNCLGGISFDEHEWGVGAADSDIQLSPGISLCDGNYGAGTEANVRGSRWGSKFQPVSEHTNRSDAFITRTEDFISYYCWAKNFNYTVDANGYQSFLTSHFDGDGAPNGAARIVLDIGLAGAWTYYLPRLQYKRAGVWTNLALAANAVGCEYRSIDCYALQVDLTNGDAAKCEARLMHYDSGAGCINGAKADSNDNLNEDLDDSETGVDVNFGALFSADDIIQVDNEIMYVDSVAGDTLTVQRGYFGTVAAVHANNTDIYIHSASWHEEITWTAVPINGAILAAGVLATPSLGFIQVTGKGTTNISATLSSYWVYEADAAANLPEEDDGSGYDYETWATYCKADDTVGNWAATGGGCAGLHRVLCDPEEPDATVNGYISVVGNGSAETYLGEVADIGAANGNQMQTLDGVGVTAILDYSPGEPPAVNNGVDDIGLSYNGTASWKTGEFGYRLENETTKYAFWDKNPEGDAWVVGDLAGLLAGVKSDAGNDGRCYGLIIHLVGSGGRRPTNDLEACPVGARRVFVYHG